MIEYAESLPASIAKKREKGEPKPADEIRDSRLFYEEMVSLCNLQRNKTNTAHRCDASCITRSRCARFSYLFFRDRVFGSDIKLSIESNDSVYTLTACFPVFRPAPSDGKSEHAPCRESRSAAVGIWHCKVVHFLGISM